MRFGTSEPSRWARHPSQEAVMHDARTSPRRGASLAVLGLVLVSLAAGPASSQAPARGHGAEAHDMELVGHDELQGRSAYQPTIHQQRGRFIAYVGHHGGRARNPLTGADEDNGTSIVDVTDPARPRYLAHIRGMPGGPELAGQEPGSTGPIPVAHGVHGPIVLGNRAYFAYGTSADGVLQIVDRQKLVTGPKEPTAANLNDPEISRLYMSPNWGGHTAFPVLGIPIADWAANTKGRVRDFVVLVSEATANECREFRHAAFMVDVTTETRPFSVATLQVPESQGNFCRRGGRFGPHSSSESFAPIFYKKLVFLAYFNGGVRAMDIRHPYALREAGFYIPATTERTAERCVTNGTRSCKVAIQTNNVEADERGFVYLADRANTGLHIVKLTGEAAKIGH